jgi:hypothetical protein
MMDAGDVALVVLVLLALAGLFWNAVRPER